METKETAAKVYLDIWRAEGYYVVHKYVDLCKHNHYVLIHHGNDKPAILAIQLEQGLWSAWRAIE